MSASLVIIKYTINAHARTYTYKIDAHTRIHTRTYNLDTRIHSDVSIDNYIITSTLQYINREQKDRLKIVLLDRRLVNALMKSIYGLTHLKILQVNAICIQSTVRVIAPAFRIILF